MAEDLPLVIHQSDLQSINRCPQEFWLSRQQTERRTNSRTAYGSVMHHALNVMVAERSLDKALATFRYYWHPLHIDAIAEPVPSDGWLANDSYGGMLRKGEVTLRAMWDIQQTEEAELLALEYSFAVPLVGTPYWLAGEVDKLTVRRRKSILELHVEDYKTGAQKWGLRWNVQGTIYSYATLQREFWLPHDVELRRLGGGRMTYRSEGFGDRGEALHERMAGMPRRFIWINTKDFKWRDGGYRDEQDYARLRVAVEQVDAMDRAGVWPLRLDGETCQYCDFRKVCPDGWDAPVPDEEHGDPFKEAA